MAAPTTAPIPPDRDLGGGYTVQVVALDATTGAVLTGLVVTNAVMVVDNVGGLSTEDLLKDVEPLFVPIPNAAVSSPTEGA